MSNKKTLPCNKPVRSDRPGKRMKVRACEDGKEKLVHFGDSSMRLNYSKEANKNFRARHSCDEKKSKLSAGYWSCRNWPASKPGTGSPFTKIKKSLKRS